MTIYEILAIATPAITIIVGGLITYVVKGLDNRIGFLEREFSNLKGEVYFIKGLIEGKSMK